MTRILAALALLAATSVPPQAHAEKGNMLFWKRLDFERQMSQESKDGRFILTITENLVFP